jgi:GPN-loop GTPase
VVNLDPTRPRKISSTPYPVSIDIRELISVDDVATELAKGPNGALVNFTEFLLRNIEWLEDKIEFYDDNLYLVFDLPGQTEMYAHFPFMRDLVRKLESWGFRLQAIYMLDSHFTLCFSAEV